MDGVAMAMACSGVAGQAQAGERPACRGGKKFRYVARMWSGGVTQLPAA